MDSILLHLRACRESASLQAPSIQDIVTEALKRHSDKAWICKDFHKRNGSENYFEKR